MSEPIGTSVAALLRTSHSWANAIQRAVVAPVEDRTPATAKALARLLHRSLTTDVRSELAHLREAAGRVALEMAYQPDIAKLVVVEYERTRGPADPEYLEAYAVSDHDLGRLYPLGLVYAKRMTGQSDTGRLVRRGIEVFGAALVNALSVVRQHEVVQ